MTIDHGGGLKQHFHVGQVNFLADGLHVVTHWLVINVAVLAGSFHFSISNSAAAMLPVNPRQQMPQDYGNDRFENWRP
jgi:hypothetical protein